jgi:hypothetical protein
MATPMVTLPRRFLRWLSGGRPLTFDRPPFAPEFALIHRPLTEDGAHVIAAQLAVAATAGRPRLPITEGDIRRRLEQATLADADPSDLARIVAVLQEAGFPTDLDDLDGLDDTVPSTH